MDILCLFLSCICYAFVRVCLYVPCGHLLGKGCPLGTRLCTYFSTEKWQQKSPTVKALNRTCVCNIFQIYLNVRFQAKHTIQLSVIHARYLIFDVIKILSMQTSKINSAQLLHGNGLTSWLSCVLFLSLS